eukprot:jgi/Mesvir1/7776/Mv11719-RA.1
MSVLSLSSSEESVPDILGDLEYDGWLFANHARKRTRVEKCPIGSLPSSFVFSRMNEETDAQRKAMLAGILENGYAVLRMAVPSSEIVRLRNLAAEKRFERVNIFQTSNPDGTSNAGDRHRFQYRLVLPHDQEELDAWKLCVRLVWSNVSEDYRCIDVTLLYSDPGCARQAPHRDFRPEPERWKERFPVSCMLALEDRTRFIAYRSRRTQFPIDETDDDLRDVAYPTEVTLRAGDMLVWHGNLVHAGAAYPKHSNARLFFSAIHVEDDQSISYDETFLVRGGRTTRQNK